MHRYPHSAMGSFNTQPPEGGCVGSSPTLGTKIQVSTHSHPKVAAYLLHAVAAAAVVSTHSHPKVAADVLELKTEPWHVSTHSHPKVAALLPLAQQAAGEGFNTQPPEGGCKVADHAFGLEGVSTHSHPKVAAAAKNIGAAVLVEVSTHSHPKVAAEYGADADVAAQVSTHSHPKVAARVVSVLPASSLCFNTQPPEGGC